MPAFQYYPLSPFHGLEFQLWLCSPIFLFCHIPIIFPRRIFPPLQLQFLFEISTSNSVCPKFNLPTKPAPSRKLSVLVKNMFPVTESWKILLFSFPFCPYFSLATKLAISGISYTTFLFVHSLGRTLVSLSLYFNCLLRFLILSSLNQLHIFGSIIILKYSCDDLSLLGKKSAVLTKHCLNYLLLNF